MAVKILIVAVWVMALFHLYMVGIISEEHVAYVFRVVVHFKASCFCVVTASSFVSLSCTVLAAYGSLCPTHFLYLVCFCPHEERSIFHQNSENHLLDCMNTYVLFEHLVMVFNSWYQLKWLSTHSIVLFCHNTNILYTYWWHVLMLTGFFGVGVGILNWHLW